MVSPQAKHSGSVVYMQNISEAAMVDWPQMKGPKWQDVLPGLESFAPHQVYSGSLLHQLFMSSNNSQVLRVSSWTSVLEAWVGFINKNYKKILVEIIWFPLSGLLLRSLYYSNSHLGKPCPEGLDCPSFSTESWCNEKSQATRQS